MIQSASRVPEKENANIARHLTLMAASQPAVPALKVPRGRSPSGDIDYLVLSFAELEAEVAAWRRRLAAAGMRPGDRVLVMVRPGLPLIACVFALFQSGGVPVVIDPGMGLRSFLKCVERSRPRVFVGIPIARIIRRVFPGSFRTVEVTVPASGSLTSTIRNPQSELRDIASPVAAPSDLAAILFTSGSTGAPKGVRYEHGMFEAQVRAIRETYRIEPGEVDLPMLPIFALFNPALGMTTVVPEIDPRRPASVDPERIVRAIQQEKVTNSFGSPTLWRKIFDHCIRDGITLHGLRRVLCAGAPVTPSLFADSRKVLTGGSLYSPYGATEALPLTSIDTNEVLSPEVRTEALRFGTCVGRPVAGVDVRIIAIEDGPITSITDARELAPGDIGEIVVRGPMVTKAYDGMEEATALAKIPSGNSQTPKDAKEPRTSGVWDLEFGVSAASVAAVWHRMGDCGRVDGDGRLWFCGRKAERVTTADGVLFTDPCEQVFREAFPGIRVALVGLGSPGAMTPAIVVEESRQAADWASFRERLREVARSQKHTAAIRTFFLRGRFPVDVRHNAKIHRLQLARWAAGSRGWVAES